MSDRAANANLTGSDYEPAWLTNLLNAGSAVAMNEVNRALYGADAMERQAVEEVRGNRVAAGANWFAANWQTVALVAAAVLIPGGFLLWFALRKK